MARRITLDSIYWKLSALAGNSSALSAVFHEACLKYAARRDALLRLMQSQVAPGSVVYDVGAYVGLYSCALARGVEGSLIYAFEPNPRAMLALARTIASLKLDERVISRDIALGSEDGGVTLHVSSYGPRSSIYERYAEYDGNEVARTLSVPCHTIDHLVEGESCKPPDAMKIDVEGHEYDVLLGARNTIASRVPQIFVETHGGEGGRSNRDRVKDALTPFGYEFEDVGCAMWCHQGEANR